MREKLRVLVAVCNRHCVAAYCEKRQAQGLVKDDMDGRVNWTEHCVEFICLVIPGVSL